jgi:hypothetical protein
MKLIAGKNVHESKLRAVALQIRRNAAVKHMAEQIPNRKVQPRQIDAWSSGYLWRLLDRTQAERNGDGNQNAEEN